MTAKHTPGTWRFGGANSWVVFSAESGKDICRVSAGNNPLDAVANARLITAAPELLAAAKFLLSRLEDGSGQQMRVYSDTLHPTDDDKTVVHLLREAIQAAGGER